MYPILLSVHIIAVISWMAALLYVPRLFVYHADVTRGGEADLMLQTMERRLLRYIALPAMTMVFITGPALIYLNPALMKAPWLHLKFLPVIGLAAFHGVCAGHRKRFVRGEGFHTSRFYRVMNEIPTVFMIIIVFLAICKPGMGVS